MKKKLIDPLEYPPIKREGDNNFKWAPDWSKEEIEGIEKWINYSKYKKNNFDDLENFEKNNKQIRN